MVDFELNERQRELQAKARTFALTEMLPLVYSYDELDRTPVHLIEKAFQAGIMNLGIPVQYGGFGGGLMEEAVVVEEVAAAGPGMATSIFANSLGQEPLILCNNEEAKAKYLGMLAREFKLISFATSEPNMGSDVGGIICKATRDGDDWVLNGKKYWVTNGGIADYITVFANADPQSKHKGICAFIVPTDAPGLVRGRHIPKMGHRCSNTVGIRLDNVRVPAADCLAPPGEGFPLAMKTFSRTRPIIGAMATGLARSAMEFAIDYVKKRRAFGQKIGDFQSIQFMIAGMYQKVETARLLTWRSAWEADQERDPLLYASMTKLYATEIALEVASDALQCFGGYGYTKMMPIEKLFRDAKLYQIYEGTTQVQKMIIGRAALHEYKPVMPALEDLPREDLRVSIGEDGELDIYERYADETGRTGWRCRICGYIHYGDEPPESCPICLFPGSVFKRVIH